MQRVTLVLLYISRTLAICAILAGLGPGCLEASFAGLVCADQCPAPEFYVANFGSGDVELMKPFIVIEALAMTLFLVYCLATRQVRRTVIVLVVLLVGGLVGVAALVALAQHARAMLPDVVTEANYYTYMDQLEALGTEWGFALMLVAGVWSSLQIFLQWKR